MEHSKGSRVLQQVKRPPRDRMELERYLRIADDFVESQRYKMLDSTTLRCLAAGVIPGLGIKWPMANSSCCQTQ
jgi:hypothetical protein